MAMNVHVVCSPASAVVEPGDHHVAEAVQQRDERQQRAVGARGQHAVGEVGDDQQPEHCDQERHDDRRDLRVLAERRERVGDTGDGRGHHDQAELCATPGCGDRCRAHGPDVLVPTIVVVGLDVAVVLVELAAGTVSGVVAGSVIATVVVGASSS